MHGTSAKVSTVCCFCKNFSLMVCFVSLFWFCRAKQEDHAGYQINRLPSHWPVVMFHSEPLGILLYSMVMRTETLLCVAVHDKPHPRQTRWPQPAVKAMPAWWPWTTEADISQKIFATLLRWKSFYPPFGEAVTFSFKFNYITLGTRAFWQALCHCNKQEASRGHPADVSTLPNIQCGVLPCYHQLICAKHMPIPSTECLQGKFVAKIAVSEWASSWKQLTMRKEVLSADSIMAPFSCHFMLQPVPANIQCMPISSMALKN